MSLLLVGLVAGVLGLFYYVWQYYKNVAKYPKGPTPLPFIGNFHQLDPTRLGEHFIELSKVYGNIFTVFIPMPVVILADYETMKEAFVNGGDVFSGRAIVPFIPDQFCENSGVINANGESWRENRRHKFEYLEIAKLVSQFRHSVSILRDFGMGKGLMEEKVKLSIMEYLRCLDGIEDKKHVDLRWPVQLMVANVINETLFGFRYKYDDCAPLMNYVEAFNQLLITMATSLMRFVATSFPSVKYIPILNYYAITRFEDIMKPLTAYISENVEKSMETYSADAEPECFVHAYAQRIPGNEWLNEAQLKAVCSDFFAAGQETTGTTLRWAFLYLAADQDVQDRLRAEILSIVGKDRLPSMSDKAKMPYTCATVHEVQRKANLMKMNVLRRTLADTDIMGHKIPRETLVNGDIHHIMAEDPIFENPEEFLPERYINEDGKTLNKDVVERTVPFSIGKRQCAGEGLARVELFLGLAATVQHYRILPCDDGPVDLECEQRLVRLPRQQRLCIEKVL